MKHENIFVKLEENSAETQWPVPALGGVKVDNKFMLADAERTPKTMHFEPLGEVWIVEITYPNLKDTDYPIIYNTLKNFVFYVRFWNPWINGDTTIRVYRGDVTITRASKDINEPITIVLTGTETLS